MAAQLFFRMDCVRRAWLCLPLLAVFAFFCGCATTPQEKTVFFISLHTVVAESEAYGGGVDYVKDDKTGKFVAVRKVFLIKSSNIERAEVLKPKDSSNKYGLRLFLDSHGMNQFYELQYHNTDRLAVLIDGFLQGVLVVSGTVRAEESIDLPMLWSQAEAERIAVRAAKNYRIIHDSSIDSIL